MARVLAVDDVPAFRQTFRQLLESRQDFQLVGEASDGLEAVQKAQELQPDLILLDIGLPKLNGIEAARRIRRLAPQTKILFLSIESSADVVREALRLGLGYVLKVQAQSELLRAMEAVVRGGRFISSSLAGHDPSIIDEHSDDHPQWGTVFAPLPPKYLKTRHEVELYPDDVAFVDGFARLIAAALRAGSPVIVIATESHRAGILERLRADTVDISAAIEQGGYISLDARDTLAKFMVDDLPDPVRCAKVVGDLITGVAKGNKGKNLRVAICGECAPTLLAEGNAEGAIRLEHLWDEVTSRYDADTLCGYLRTAFSQQEQSGQILERICAEHSAVHGRRLGY